MISYDKNAPEIDNPNGFELGKIESEQDEMSTGEFSTLLLEVKDQPPFKAQADKEMEYKDGNQLDSSFLEKMKELGIPPAVAPMIGLSIESALGAEARRRTDWRCLPDGDDQGQEIADAINWKLNTAERRSRADRACSDAYESQYSVGIGWVEVTRDMNPMNYPYRVNHVHRNEMFWDWDGYLKSPMGLDARFVGRRKWVDKDIAKLLFPDKAELLESMMAMRHGIDVLGNDGGLSTGLYFGQDQLRGWTIEEQEWRNTYRRKVMLYEVWYRRWYRSMVIALPDGLTTEFHIDDPQHQDAVLSGVMPSEAILSRVRRAWFAGPLKVADEEPENQSRHFPYVPFWGHREDRTGVPYGRIRAMMYMQDNINASLSKIRWGLSSTRVIRTDGAYKGSNDQLRNEVARPDTDIVLNREHMAMPGAKFEISRDFELSQQQYQMYLDSKATLKELGGTSPEFMGQSNGVNTASQFDAVVEQSNQGLANIDDNFKESRSHVGELLMELIICDLKKTKDHKVTIEGNALRDDRVITLNESCYDEMGNEYVNNDVSRVMLKVDLDDVPSTSSFRKQQLSAFSEAFKSTSPDYQRIMMPHIINLMDMPNKAEIVKAMKEHDAQPSPEQIEQERKVKELELKQEVTTAQVKLLSAQGVKTMTEAQYAAFQAGLAMASTPNAATVSSIADVVVQNAGMQNPAPVGIDPNYEQALPVQQNTSPQLPPVPQQVNVPSPNAPEPAPMPDMNGEPLHGIETMRPDDNNEPS